MPVQRLNHAVLFVSNVKQSVEFYGKALGFKPIEGSQVMPGAAFLQAAGSSNDHDLGLFEVGADSEIGRQRSRIGLYHLAWEVDTLSELKRIALVLEEMGALSGATDHSTTKALYGSDPDGIEFEVSWLVPANLITEEMKDERMRLKRLNIDAEIARFGADTKGGVGISH